MRAGRATLTSIKRATLADMLRAQLSGARASSLHAEGKHLPTYETESMIGDALELRDDLRRRAEHADLADQRTIAALGVDGIVNTDLDV